MEDGLAERFMRALQEAEETGNVTPVVALFDEEGEATNLGRTEPAHGREAIREFWQTYLSAFQTIRSEFTHAFESEQGAVLEWISRGRLRNGEAVEYRGVSVLEAEDERIHRFRTYYDSAVFLPQGAKTASGDR